MKKTIRAIAIATAITIAIMISCACAMPAQAAPADHGEFFPCLSVVVGYEHVTAEEWLIECMDKDGEIWSFYGEEEDAHIGIMFNLLLWDLGDEIQVVECYYEGRMEQDAMMEWMNHD